MDTAWLVLAWHRRCGYGWRAVIGKHEDWFGLFCVLDKSRKCRDEEVKCAVDPVCGLINPPAEAGLTIPDDSINHGIALDPLLYLVETRDVDLIK